MTNHKQDDPEGSPLYSEQEEPSGCAGVSICIIGAALGVLLWMHGQAAQAQDQTSHHIIPPGSGRLQPAAPIFPPADPPIIMPDGTKTTEQAADSVVADLNSKPTTASDELPNEGALLDYMLANYQQDVDCVAVLDRFKAVVAELPELPQTETVTAFTVIARYESRGQDWSVSWTHDFGVLQCNRCHKRPMTAAGLDFNDETDRERWCAGMVASKLADGKSWWGAFSPWTVVTIYHRNAVRSDYEQLMAGVN